MNHPWTNNMLFGYNTEALLWGDFIDQHLSEFPAGEKVTVAALAMNNDFGKVYDQAFRAYLAQSPNKDQIDYTVEFIEPQAATVTDPMTTLASKNPDVFIEMLTGTPCAQAITEAAQNGMNEKTKYRFVSSVCKSATFVGQGGVGDASERLVGRRRRPARPRLAGRGQRALLAVGPPAADGEGLRLQDLVASTAPAWPSAGAGPRSTWWPGRCRAA